MRVCGLADVDNSETARRIMIGKSGREIRPCAYGPKIEPKRQLTPTFAVWMSAKSWLSRRTRLAPPRQKRESGSAAGDTVAEGG